MACVRGTRVCDIFTSSAAVAASFALSSTPNTASRLSSVCLPAPNASRYTVTAVSSFSWMLDVMVHGAVVVDATCARRCKVRSNTALRDGSVGAYVRFNDPTPRPRPASSEVSCGGSETRVL